MGQEIDYAAVLADLEARKTALDAAIAAVKAILGQGPVEALGLSSGGTRQIGIGSEPQEVTPGVFHGLSVSQAAKKYLEMKKTKQRTKDIAKAIREGGIETTASNFYANVFNTLKRGKDFIKLGKQWGLAEWHPTRVSTIPDRPTRKTRRARKERPKKAEPSKLAEGASAT